MVDLKMIVDRRPPPKLSLEEEGRVVWVVFPEEKGNGISNPFPLGLWEWGGLQELCVVPARVFDQECGQNLR